MSIVPLIHGVIRMRRHRRSRGSRRETPDYIWMPWLERYTVSLPNDTTTVKAGVLGYLDLPLRDAIDSDATVERMRGRLICVKSTTGTGQFIVAGRFIDKDLAEATKNEEPDLFALATTGDDFPLWLPFACVDSDATSMWNGHEVDVKARRRINKSSVLQIVYNGRSLDTTGVNENYTFGFNLRMLVKLS